MKTNHAAISLIALGLLALSGVSLAFHVYPDDIMRAGFLGLPDAMSRPVLSSDIIGTTGLVTGGIALIGMLLFIFGKKKEINKHDVFAFLFITFGFVTITGLNTAFYPCRGTFVISARSIDAILSAHEQGALYRFLRPMRCFYTMRVLVGTAGALGIVGVLMLVFRKSKEVLKGLGLASILIVIMFYVNSSIATGMCPTPTMECVTHTKPFLFVITVLTAVFAAVNAFFIFRKTGEDR